MTVHNGAHHIRHDMPPGNGVYDSTSATADPGRLGGSIATRWASFVLRTIDAEEDPRTMATWARSVGVSRSALCECCRLVHVTPHDARDFTRFMRAILRSGPFWRPETVLDLADARTLRKLLSRAGLTGSEVLTPSAGEFLERQQWIPASNPGLVALRRVMMGDDPAERPAP